MSSPYVFSPGARNILAPEGQETTLFGSVSFPHIFRAGARNNLAPEGQETTFLGPCPTLTFLGQGQETGSQGTTYVRLTGARNNLTPPRANGPPQELEGGARSAPYF